MRGGTSRALVFHARDLPAGRDGWAPLFCGALGSPDPGERQLDGLGGGISSLSKVAIVGSPSVADADVDYTFAQVSVSGTNVSYRGNCGNISAAIGPFAVDEGLVPARDGEALVRIHNTNTGKMIHARFGVVGGKAQVSGDFSLQGVAGTGAPIFLDFIEPGGAATGRLLPTGSAQEVLDVPGVGAVAVSLVDAANPTVFVAAESLGLGGDEAPAAIGAAPGLLTRLDALRVAAAVAMGVAGDEREAREEVPNLPLVALLSTSQGIEADITVRMISAGQPHRATPLTAAMCVAVAARIPHTLVARIMGDGVGAGDPVRIAHPTGILPVEAVLSVRNGQPHAERATVIRTARRLMEGRVLVPVR